MLRNLRSFFFPVLALLIALTGASYGLSGAALPFTNSGDEIVLENESTYGDDPVQEVEEQETETEELGTLESNGESNAKGDESEGENNVEGENEEPKLRSREGCPAEFPEGGTHGQYVSSTEKGEARQAAAHSECGKPVKEDKPEKKVKDNNKDGSKHPKGEDELEGS